MDPVTLLSGLVKEAMAQDVFGQSVFGQELMDDDLLKQALFEQALLEQASLVDDGLDKIAGLGSFTDFLVKEALAPITGAQAQGIYSSLVKMLGPAGAAQQARLLGIVPPKAGMGFGRGALMRAGRLATKGRGLGAMLRWI